MNKARTAKLSLRKLFVAMLAVGPMAILPSQLLAVVPAGSTAPFTQTNGTGASWFGDTGSATGTITAPDRAILVWNAGAFQIAANEKFSFVQPAGSAVLNKVGYNTNGTPATLQDNAVINGQLTSSGRVFILANGNITVGSGAAISTLGGLFLSTLTESSDFTFSTSGNLAFNGGSTGTITVGATNGALNPANSSVGILGGLGLWSHAVAINNLSVSGDMIVSQNNTNTTTSLSGANQTLTLTGANGATSVTGNLTAVSNNGVITQNGAQRVVVNGTSTFNTNGNVAVTLTNVANTFGGAVSVASGTGFGGNASLVSGGGLTLAASTVGGDLSATAAAGNVTTSGTVAVVGNATFSAAGGNVNVANNSSVGGSVAVTGSAGAGGVSIATVGNLTVGAITSTGTAPGVSIASTGNVTLNGTITPNNGNVSVSAPSVNSSTAAVVNSTNYATFTSTNGNLVLPAVTTAAAGGFTASATNGSITQNGTLTIPSTFVANAGTGNITLTNNNSLTSTTSLTGNNISLSAVSPLTIGVTAAGDATFSTVNATYSTTGANGAVVMGGGGGSSAFPFVVGKNLTITTNGGSISQDQSSIARVEGAVNLNTFVSTGGLLSVPVAAGGTGYTAVPTITFSAPTTAGGVTATGTLVMSGGSVTGVKMVLPGSGYTAAPTITFSTVVTGGTGFAAGTPVVGLGTGNITFDSPNSSQSLNARFGQFTANGNSVVLIESTGLNLGNITANTLNGVSWNGEIVMTGNVLSLSSVTLRADQNEGTGEGGTITQRDAGTLTSLGTTALRVRDNALGFYNLNSTTNVFQGAVTIVNGGGANIITSNSSISFRPGNTATGSLTINAINTDPTKAQVSIGNAGATRATNLVVNTSGQIVLTGNIDTNRLTLNTTSTTANSILQTSGNLSVNGTLTITNAGTTNIISKDNSNGNINVVLANVTGPETTIYGGKNVTISGNSTGNVTVVAGTNGLAAAGGFSNPWSLILGNLNVAGLNGVAMNGGTALTGTVSAATINTNAGGLLNGGVGYTATPTVTFSAPPAGGTTATGTATVVGGVVTGITITNAGAGYTAAPTVAFGAAGATTVAAATASLLNDAGSFNGGTASEGNSGNITQVANSLLHVENGINLVTYNGNILVGNNGNSNGRVQLSTGGLLGKAGTGNITYSEDGTAKIGNIHTSGTATLTSRFGSVIEDPVNNVNVTAASLVASSPAGSIQLAGATRTAGTTAGVVDAVSLTAPTGSAQVASTGNIALGAINANSLTVTSGANITQTDAARVFGAASITAAGTVALTNTANNFGPVSVNVTAANQNIAITESGTLNLRSIKMVQGNGTFSATSVNGDIVDTGLSGVVVGGTIGAVGSGVATLSAPNGNITIDDPTTDFPTNGGVVFNAKNVNLSVLGNGGTTLVLGAAGVTSSVSGNFTATSALGDIANAGNIVIAGDAFFQTGTKNVTLGQAGNNFGTLKFVGNQVAISQTGDMKIVTGSQAIGPAQLATQSGNITIVDRGGLVSFGNTVALNASGSITVPKKIQAVGTLTVNAAGTKDLSALSYSGDLNSKAPVNSGLGTYIKPPDAP